jgi:hypothetical protein
MPLPSTQCMHCETDECRSSGKARSLPMEVNHLRFRVLEAQPVMIGHGYFRRMDLSCTSCERKPSRRPLP